MTTFLFLLFFAGALLVKHLFFWSPMDVSHLYGEGPLLMGHRGSPKEAPENTIESFRKAVESDLRAVEMDVLCTADGKVVCSHNHDLERETDGYGYIHETLYADLETINAGARFKKIAHCSLPSLEEVISSLPDDCIMNIEVKSLSALDLGSVLKVVNLIEKYDIARRVLISSFNPLVLWRVKMLNRCIPTAYLWSNENVPPVLMKPRFINLVHPDMLHPADHLVDESVFHLVKRKNLRLNVWTVNNLPAMKWLLEQGVDGLISDFPALMLNAVGKKSPRRSI
ncbi:MAG: glycerophosphodiester phosphodiesterase family protein [Candidatus Neomarinimicrobiota bacterium]|nr:glycerophosphodiester phosphodiesterase family protein [Candidatus Neomarinimicrobiota bacterium]